MEINDPSVMLCVIEFCLSIIIVCSTPFLNLLLPLFHNVCLAKLSRGETKMKQTFYGFTQLVHCCHLFVMFDIYGGTEKRGGGGVR